MTHAEVADRNLSVHPSMKLEKPVDSLGPTVPAVGHAMALLNLGCGAEGHPAFVNVDLAPAPGVIGHDLRMGIPFPDSTYDLVYHSTMLSMMRPPDALGLMRECHRVLRPGGVLRVVTEDLEQMCRVYLEKLEQACLGDRDSAMDYEWMLLELYDQATREFPGGEMVRYLRDNPVTNEAFIYSRTGEQGRCIVSAIRSRAGQNQGRPRVGWRHALAHLRANVRKLLLTALLGPRNLQALEIGRFRLSSGQVSYRMYDRYSLAQLFVQAGLSHVSLQTATTSAYPSWASVNLDVNREGDAARPHALIMEGLRTS